MSGPAGSGGEKPPSARWLGAAVVILGMLLLLFNVISGATIQEVGLPGLTVKFGARASATQSASPSSASPAATTEPATPPPTSSGPVAPCPRDTEVSISPTSGGAATTIVVSGTGFDPGEPVEIRFHSQVVGEAHTDINCAFSGVRIGVPQFFRSFAPSSFDITATGKRSIRSARQPFMLTR